MTKEEMKIYADKYRRTQNKIYKGFAIFILLIAIALVTAAILLFIHANNEVIIYVVASVMVLLAGVDIYFDIRFIKYSKNRYKTISDMEAATHYCKIHGFDSKLEK